MTPADRCSGLVLLALALVILGFTTQLRMGELRSLGPGAFPLILAGLLVTLSAALVVQQVRRGLSAGLLRAVALEDSAAPAWFVVLFAGYAATFEPLGFVVSTFLFLALLLWIVERKSLVASAAYAGGVSALAYWFFALLLRANLPQGILG